MLTLCDSLRGIDRRGFLTVGGLALGGLSLSHLLAASDRPRLTTGKSVIFLFQQGGPSQFETYDPKPDAPDGVRTVTDLVPTAIPGIRFGEPMNKLAKLAKKFTVYRSFQTNNAGHNIVPIVCPETLNANMGSLYSRVAGAVHPETGMPTNAVLFPQAVCSDVTKGSARGNIAATGTMGTAYAPFIPGGGGQLEENMRLKMPRDRFEDRKELLASLGRLQHDYEKNEQVQVVDQFQSQAAQVLLSGKVAAALDLTQEPRSVLERYDTNKYVSKDNWEKAQRGKRGYYTGSAKSIGKLLLMARRLCEAGCGFVTIHADYEGVWDMHADGNNLNMIDGMNAIGRPFDHAVSAFIEDVEARGLRDKILLVCCGEMGRTPKLNKNGGRDHWAKLAPLMLYGGGTEGGRVIGQSTKDGGEPASESYNLRHLVSTVLHTVFDVGQLRLVSGLGEIARLAEHAPLA